MACHKRITTTTTTTTTPLALALTEYSSAEPRLGTSDLARRRRPGTEPLTTQSLASPCLQGRHISIFCTYGYGCALPTPPRRERRAGFRRPMRQTESWATELTGCPPVPREPLTTWKLRYKASSMRSVETIIILPTPCPALHCIACSYSLRLYSPATRLIIARYASCHWS